MDRIPVTITGTLVKDSITKEARLDMKDRHLPQVITHEIFDAFFNAAQDTLKEESRETRRKFMYRYPEEYPEELLEYGDNDLIDGDILEISSFKLELTKEGEDSTTMEAADTFGRAYIFTEIIGESQWEVYDHCMKKFSVGDVDLIEILNNHIGYECTITMLFREINRPEFKTMETGMVIQFLYVNYKGEFAKRRAIVKRFLYGSTKYHRSHQWLVEAYDLDKEDHRVFAMSDMTDILVIKKGVTT